MKRTAIYMRVSSDRQAKEGDSIPAQRDALLKYITDRHLTLAGEYLDDGISGTKSDRDELQRLLSDVDKDKIDLIIFTKLDRWFRSVRHYTATQEILDRHGVAWTAIWEPIYDTTTPAGRLIVNQMMSIAQFEAENTGQRIRQVFAYKVTKGEVLSGNTSPGYQIKDKHLIPDELAPAVREVFEFYARTGCLADTVRIAAKGLPTSKSGIKQMLRKRVYIGEMYGKPGYCEPIIERELFDRVQMQLSRNVKKSQKHIYLFSGLLVCSECGSRMAACTRIKRGIEVRQYRCPKHFQNAIKSCGNSKLVTESVLEKYLIGNLAPLVSEYRFRAEADQAPAKDLIRKRDAIEKKISRLKDLYINELITMEEYRRDRETYENELAGLAIPEEPPKSPLNGFEPVEGINIYRELGEPEKRLFWRLIIKEIRFGKDRQTDVIFL